MIQKIFKIKKTAKIGQSEENMVCKWKVEMEEATQNGDTTKKNCDTKK